MAIAKETAELLAKLGVAGDVLSRGDLVVLSPVSSEQLAALKTISAADANKAIDAAHETFEAWRPVPGPKRGELVRLLGEELRAHKAELGRLVSIEVGKIPSEGRGEVQEMIDICDFAVGLSRQLYGLTIATERPGHRMTETWHPLCVVGVISCAALRPEGSELEVRC
ncbi:acyl-CoA reductase-like NAD-dependent aldehyde dehydrogenase [Mesorhizobium soli]|nr:acyl-CoA reductase-like NAD-dependent aldehyde dehydrogenase [Mesorhizobium soli]